MPARDARSARDARRRAHRLLTHALQRPAGARTAYIRDACQHDPDLADQATRLMRAAAAGAQEQSGDAPTLDFPDRPRDAPADEARDGEDESRQAGNYCLLRVIGTGATAVVYEATQSRPRRRVAVKVMRRGLANTQAAARFHLESELLARLDHPGIAKIHEAGLWERDDGVATPFYAMELVAGAKPITAHADDAKLDLRGRVALLLGVCDAVQHGHSLGIIHRDLKPANVLVDAAGRAKVIDFGIARSGGPHGPNLTAEATPEAVLGTLHYMSPEQCVPGSVASTRCDVHALGVILFELLCGRLPRELSELPLPEALRRVRECEPARPRAANPALPADLEAVVLMALACEPAERYQSAAALAADLRRWLADEAVEARPPTWLATARRFARRHKAVATSAAAIATVAALALAVSVGFARRTAAESESRRLAEGRAVAERAAALQNAYVANIAAGFAALEAGEVRDVQRRLADAPEAYRGWEWSLLRNLSARALRVDRPHEAGMIFAAADAGEGRVVTTTSRGEFALLDAATGRRLARAALAEPSRILAVEVAKDGAIAVAAESGVWTWSGRDDDAPHPVPDGAGIATDVAWLPGGRLLATYRDAPPRLLPGDTPTPTELANATGVAASADGSLLAIWSDDGTVRVCRANSLATLREFASSGERVTTAAFSRDGSLLVAGAAGGRVRVWSLGDGRLERDIATPGGQSSVRALAFSPDGNRLAVGQVDRRIFSYDLADPGAEPETLLGHGDAISHLAFAPDGRTLQSASWDGTVRTWGLVPELRSDVVRELVGHDGEVLDVAYSPDGLLLASAGRDGLVRLWDVRGQRVARTLRGHGGGVYQVAFSPDGLRVATASDDGTVGVWDVASGEPVRFFGDGGAPVWAVAFTPDGERLAAAGEDGVVRVWSVADGRRVREWAAHRERITCIALHPDGRRLATASRDGSLRLWSLDDGRLLHDFAGHGADVFAVAFDKRGELLLSGSRDQTVGVWNVGDGSARQRLAGHGQFITDLAISPDGTRLAAGSWFGRLLLWEAGTGAALASIAGDSVAVRAVAFSPDGATLAAGTHRGVVRLFAAAPPAP